MLMLNCSCSSLITDILFPWSLQIAARWADSDDNPKKGQAKAAPKKKAPAKAAKAKEPVSSDGEEGGASSEAADAADEED
jgi:hypothetical protein